MIRGSKEGKSKGGRVTAERLGQEGRKLRAKAGGQTLLRKFGSEYFRAIRLYALKQR